MFRAAIVAAASLAVFAFAPSAEAVPVVFTAQLSGANEDPPNASPGTGFAKVTFDLDTDTMRIEVTFQDLVAQNTAAHIHCCTTVPGAGTAGVATVTPTFTGFPAGTSGSYDHTFTLLDTDAASNYNAPFVAANGGTAAGAEAALFAGLLAGRAYLNIHSDSFPRGEIRGFLTTVPEPGTLTLIAFGLAGAAFARRKRKKV